MSDAVITPRIRSEAGEAQLPAWAPTETVWFIMADSFRKKVWKAFLKVVPSSLHAFALRSAFRVLKLIDDIRTIFVAVADSLRMTAQPRVSLQRTAPTASQVIASYTRGLILCGRLPAFPSRFMWLSYPARYIITPETAKIPRDVRRTQRRSDLKVKFNEDFEDIIHACREGRDHWVWLTDHLIDVYREVHRLGFVDTVGVYRDDNLVAGLWGISVGRVFAIMSVFHRESGAGSLAIGAVIESVTDNGRWSIVDSGEMNNPNYARFGAFEIPREELCELIWQNLQSQGSPAGFSPPESHRSKRESLPSLRSSHS